jgi:hypothetical protein
MTSKPPTPVARSFLVCRDLAQDAFTRDYILIRPVIDLLVPQIPCMAQLHVYLQMTSGHGSYLPSLQLLDMNEQVLWSQSYTSPFQAQDPLRIVCVAIHNIGLSFSRPGRYDLMFLANEEEVARHPLWVTLHRPGGPPPGAPPGLPPGAPPPRLG